MHQLLTLIIVLLLALGGCASTHELTDSPRDPWERMNRSIYGFNDALDKTILLPVTSAYRGVAPEFVEDGVSNMFANIGDVGVAFNNTLQFKFLDAASDIGRIVVNSTIGLLGFFDVASHMGLEKNNEDFGQTLGYWGMGSGPYLMLPIFGPSSVRDGPGKVVDHLLWPPTWADIKNSERNIITAVSAVDARSKLIDLEENAGDLSGGDRYVFIREAYLDRREFLVNDGELEADEELYDELDEE